MILVRPAEGCMVADSVAMSVGVRRFIGMHEQVTLDDANGTVTSRWVTTGEPVEVQLDSYIAKCLKNKSLIEVVPEKKGAKK